ncbi:hypothetical protein C8J57DRAFT_1237955 [Mycena rebaudengoi]|nr:hypothetical protein C8J57DRAFT_1237955 [Mycena rebaudengoi]
MLGKPVMPRWSTGNFESVRLLALTKRSYGTDVPSERERDVLCVGGLADFDFYDAAGKVRWEKARWNGTEHGTAKPVRKGHQGLMRDLKQPKRELKRNREWEGGAKKMCLGARMSVKRAKSLARPARKLALPELALKQLAFTGVYVMGEGALRVLSRGALLGLGDRVRRGPLTGLKFTGSNASAETSWPRTSHGMNSVT